MATTEAKSILGGGTAPPAVSQEHVTDRTPMGANLVAGGATFRAWAPGALAVHLRLAKAPPGWETGPASRLHKDEATGIWSGFLPGIQDGDAYRFHVVGRGSRGPKRDPYARELGPGFPDCDCIVRDPNSYPWQARGYRPPARNDLVIYQLHVGTFFAADDRGRDLRPSRTARFLDVLDRVRYLADLGFNAVEFLPIDEFPTGHSLGYNGTDYFSPEMDYAAHGDELDGYLAKLNALLAARGLGPLARRDLDSHPNQLKALIDVCHAYGIAVLMDVVYNHAGGDFGDQSLYFFDRAESHSNNDSLYFTDRGYAGGLVFAYGKAEVRQFLINNAVYYLNEYRADGFRYDEVSAIDRFGGWGFCQDLTSTVRFVRPDAPQVAEYWKDDQSWAMKPREEGGAGFDAVWYDGLREAVRTAIVQATHGAEAHVNLGAVAAQLGTPPGFRAAWRAVQHLENHDVVRVNGDGKPRVAALGDTSNPGSWYARSRARVANGLLLTAPGIPMLFMGQEMLEPRPWSDNPAFFQDTLIDWVALAADKHRGDHVRFIRELIRLRRRQPALRGEPIHVYHVDHGNRVLAFHRWIDGVGRDVVVVASLNESTSRGYRLGFPGGGRWLEVFNSDAYEDWPNPDVAGNGGAITADGPPMHGLPASAEVVLPANGLIVSARDPGD